MSVKNISAKYIATLGMGRDVLLNRMTSKLILGGPLVLWILTVKAVTNESSLLLEQLRPFELKGFHAWAQRAPQGGVDGRTEWLKGLLCGPQPWPLSILGPWTGGTGWRWRPGRISPSTKVNLAQIANSPHIGRQLRHVSSLPWTPSHRTRAD